MLLLHVILFIFYAATAIQIFYYLFFFSRVAWYKNKTAKSFPLTPVSVIICAKDEEHNLINNLQFVLEQDYPDFEVIVVNDNSSDESMNVLFDFSYKYPHLVFRNLHQESRVLMGKKYALTIGLKAAKNDIVVVTDADCVPSSKHWLREMRLKFEENKEIVLGYAPYKKLPGFLNKCIRYETFWAALHYLSFAMAKTPYMGVGRNMAYKRKLFFNQNVFVKNPELLSGDDDLFINEIATSRNTKVQLTPESFIISNPKKTWDEWIHQKKRHMSTGMHYKFKHQFLLGMQTLSLVIFYLSFILLGLYSNKQIEILGIFGIRYLIMAFVFIPSMRRLKELDLFFWFPIMDLLLPLYYYIMTPSLLNPNTRTWK